MPRILVLDDEESLRNVLAEIFSEAGYEVLLAESGDAGLQLARNQPLDLLISDLIMPGKEGIETIRQFRIRYPHIKIIAMSGRGGPYVNANLTRAKDVGADRTVPKPFSPTQIMETVRELLDAASGGSHVNLPDVPRPLY